MENKELIDKLTDLLIELHGDIEDAYILYEVLRIGEADMDEEVIKYIEENHPTEDEFNRWAYGTDGTDGHIPPIEDEPDDDYEE